MANCITCGDELHPERAERYDYCTRPGCREANAKGLDMVAVGVNKAADQYVVLTERTRKEMAGGRYKKVPEFPTASRTHARARPGRARKTPDAPPRPSAKSSTRQWSEAQENLAVIYRSMGLKPDQIAKKLGVSERLATQILLATTARARR